MKWFIKPLVISLFTKLTFVYDIYQVFMSFSEKIAVHTQQSAFYNKKK